jgi:hypothetical protein
LPSLRSDEISLPEVVPGPKAVGLNPALKLAPTLSQSLVTTAVDRASYGRCGQLSALDSAFGLDFTFNREADAEVECLIRAPEVMCKPWAVWSYFLGLQNLAQLIQSSMHAGNNLFARCVYTNKRDLLCWHIDYLGCADHFGALKAILVSEGCTIQKSIFAGITRRFQENSIIRLRRSVNGLHISIRRHFSHRLDFVNKLLT